MPIASEAMIVPDVVHGVRVAALDGPNHLAIVDGQRTRTFGELVGRIDGVAQSARLGLYLHAGDTVGVLAPNYLEYVEVVLGLASTQMPAVLMNTRLGSNALEQISQDCALNALFVHPRFPDVGQRLERTAGIPVVGFGSEYEALIAGAAARPTPPAATGEEIFCIALTGGTTGRSNGVRLSHRSRVAMYRAMRDVFGCYASDDRNLVVSPLFHGAGLNFSFETLYFGRAAVLQDAFSPEGVLESLVLQRTTNLSAVPTHLTAIFRLGERSKDRIWFARRIDIATWWLENHHDFG